MSVLYVCLTTKLFPLSKNVMKHDLQGFFVCLSHWVVVGELSQLPNNKGNQMFQKMSAENLSLEIENDWEKGVLQVPKVRNDIRTIQSDFIFKKILKVKSCFHQNSKAISRTSSLTAQNYPSVLYMSLHCRLESSAPFCANAAMSSFDI